MKPRRTPHFTVTVGDRPVAVHPARVSAMPFNRLWPGHQRALDQTRLCFFAAWDMERPVRVRVTCAREISNCRIRPYSKAVEPRIRGNVIEFDLQTPAPLTLEIDETEEWLHLFASPPEQDVPDTEREDVIWFGPGLHDAGRIVLSSGSTVYLHPQAVVYGIFFAHDAEDIRICGRGILDGSSFRRTALMFDTSFPDSGLADPRPLATVEHDTFGILNFVGCRNVEIDGLILRDPNAYNLSFFACEEIRVSNLKIVGSWRYNSDGIDFQNSSHAVVEDCFVRSFDDSLVVTGWKNFAGYPCGHLPCRNIAFRRCVVWNDWGRALEIGAACCAPEISQVTFEDCDVVHPTHVALDVQNTGRAEVRDIVFRDIRVEMDHRFQQDLIQETETQEYRDASQGTYSPRLLVAELEQGHWTRDAQPGQVSDVRFENIRVTGGRKPESLLRGLDEEHRVRHVSLKDIRFDGRPAASSEEMNLTVQPFVEDVRFER